MKLVFDLVLTDANTTVELQKQRELVRQLSKELRGAKEGTEEYARLATQLARSKQEVTRLSDEQRKLNREFKAMQVPTDSLAGMRLEYSKLSDQVARLSKEQRESQFGQNLIRNTANLKKEIDGVEQSIGRFTGNVGNYRTALKGIGDLITGGLITGGLIVGLEKVVELTVLGTQEAIKYEAALKDLQALTGVEGAQLDRLTNVEESLRVINVEGQQIVNTGPNILNALKLVGGAQPELLKNAEALGEVTKQAIVLSEASGEALEPSVKALTTILGQFNLPANDAQRVINELAAGAKEGAAEVPQITDSLREFGTVAKIVNVSTSESIALIEVLAENQLKGAEAGTQLRNVLSKLASAEILPKPAQEAFQKYGVNVKLLSDATQPLSVRLAELAKLQGDVAAQTKVFGLENLQAATILTSGVEKYNQLAGSIQNTNEAYRQAAVRADDAQTAISNLNNKALNALQENLQALTPVIKTLSDLLGFLIEDFKVLDIVTAAAVGPFTLILDNVRRTRELLFGKDFEDVQTKTLDAFEGLKVKSNEFLRPLTGQRLADAMKLNADRAALLAAEMDKSGKGAEKTKKEAEAAAGSIQALRDQVSELQKQVDRAAPNQIGKFVGDLSSKEKELERLQNIVKALKDGFSVDTVFSQILKDLESAAPDLEAAAKATGQLVDLTEEQTIAALDGNLARVQSEEFTDDQILALRKALNEGLIGLTEEEQKAREKALQDELKRRQEIKDAAVSGAESIENAIFEISKNRAEKQQQQALDLLESEYESKRLAAQGNAAQLAQIDKEYQKRRIELEKESARERKRIALTEAIVQGALTIIKSLSNPIQAIAAGIAVAAQIAIISSQKFAKGGFTGAGSIHRDETGRRVAGVVHENEYVAPTSQIERFPSIFKFLEADRVRNLRPFAQGGFTSDFTPQFALPSPSFSPQITGNFVAYMTDEQVLLMARTIAQETGAAAKDGVSDGLNTENRRKERESRSNTLREV